MLGFFSKLIFLLFLVAGSFIAYLSTNQIETETVLESNERIYSIKNAEFFGADQKGSLTYKVFSKKARSENTNNQIILDQVSLLYYSDDLNSWKISSDKGALYDNSNILVLTGNVLIRNNATLRPSIIETEDLEINPNKMTMKAEITQTPTDIVRRVSWHPLGVQCVFFFFPDVHNTIIDISKQIPIFNIIS